MLIFKSSCAEELRKERKKKTKNDAVVRLASAIHEVSAACYKNLLVVSYQSLMTACLPACLRKGTSGRWLDGFPFECISSMPWKRSHEFSQS